MPELGSYGIESQIHIHSYSYMIDRIATQHLSTLHSFAAIFHAHREHIHGYIYMYVYNTHTANIMQKENTEE